MTVSSKKESNHYDLKEMENMKNAKIVSIAWHHNNSTIAEKSNFYTKKLNFLLAPTRVGIIVCCYSFADK